LKENKDYTQEVMIFRELDNILARTELPVDRFFQCLFSYYCGRTANDRIPSKKLEKTFRLYLNHYKTIEKTWKE